MAFMALLILLNTKDQILIWSARANNSISKILLCYPAMIRYNGDLNQLLRSRQSNGTLNPTFSPGFILNLNLHGLSNAEYELDNPFKC